MSTIENESSGAAQPPVIDLDAEEIAGGSETDPPIKEPEAANPEPAAPRKRGYIFAGIAAVVAAIAGSLLYRSYGEALWPSPGTVALADRVATLEAEARTVSTQLSGLASALDGMKSQTAAADGALGDRLAATESALKSLRESLGSGAGGADNAALTARIEALEQAVAALKAAPPPSPATGEAAALTRALSGLQLKFADGAPYKDEFDVVAARVPDAPGLAELGRHAATGLANAQKLADELAAAAASLTSETPPASEADTGVWGSIVAMLGSVVKVRTIGEAGWKSISAEALTDARRGDLKAAVERLSRQAAGPPPSEIAAWLEQARSRLDAEAAIQTVSAAVLRVLAAANRT